MITAVLLFVSVSTDVI